MTNDAASKQYDRGWKEVYSGGSPEAEAKQFATFTDQIKRVQAQIKEREGIVNLFAQRKHISELKRGERGESNQGLRMFRS
jgi:hypothetical protein